MNTLRLVRASYLISVFLLLGYIPTGTANTTSLLSQQLGIESSSEQRDEAERLYQLGKQQYGDRQYSEALDSYQKALTIYQEIADQTHLGITFYAIANTHYALENYPTALAFYRQALTAYQIAENWAGVGKAYQGMGLAYTDLGQYPESIEAYQKALSFYQRVPNQEQNTGRTLYAMGQAYSNLSEYAAALERYQQALIILRELGDRTAEGATLQGIGIVYKELGQYSQALQIFQQALILIEDNDRYKGQILNSIALIYSEQEQYQQAIVLYQQALAFYQQANKPYSVALAFNNLAENYRKQGQYAQATEALTQALEIAQELGDYDFESSLLDSLGSLLADLNRPTEALEVYHEALRISRIQQDRATEAYILNNMGSLLQQQQQIEMAIAFYKQSVNVTESIRQDLQSLSLDQQKSYTQTVAETYRQLADLLLQQDRVLEAQRVLDLLKVQELEDYLGDVRGNPNTRQGIEVLRPEQAILDQYSQLQTSAIQLGQKLAQLRQIPEAQRNDSQQQQITQLVQLQQDLTEQFNQFITSPEITTLIQQLSRTTQQHLALEELAGLQDDLKQLNAILLYPLILPDRLELVITTPDSPPLRRTVPVTREQLNQAILEFRQALEDPTQDAKAPAQKLYTWLIKPLEADLTQSQIQTILYAPDGNLRYIPLAALHDGTQWLAQRYRINNITARSLKDIHSQPVRQPHVLAGAFADRSIRYTLKVGQQDTSFTGLPAAGREVSTLTQTLPNTTAFLNQNFTFAAFQPRMNEYNIIHFATHAIFVPGTPEDSFILFGDGKTVTLADIQNWSLKDVDLVVLSACETGLGGNLGNGEEILGLGYQMQRAGARAAIASLWSVDDGGTQAFMDVFYASLQAGNTKAEALRQAQNALITDSFESLEDQSRGIVGIRQRIQQGVSPEVIHRLAHPYYWAAFFLIGNGL